MKRNNKLSRIAELEKLVEDANAEKQVLKDLLRQEVFALDDLSENFKKLEDKLERAETTIQCFFTGHTPPMCDLTMLVMAQWGRKRLAEIKSVAKLLVSTNVAENK
jgi:hypothetical protein